MDDWRVLSRACGVAMRTGGHDLDLDTPPRLYYRVVSTRGRHATAGFSAARRMAARIPGIGKREAWGGSRRWGGRLRTRAAHTFLPSQLSPERLTEVRFGEPVFPSREGIVLLQRHKRHEQRLRLPSGGDVITKWLRQNGALASPSDAGRVADRMLAALGGLHATRLVAHKETLKFLDGMARSIRGLGDGTHEQIPDRVAPYQEWMALLGRRNKARSHGTIGLEDFVKAGALKLGLVVKCPTCGKRNWYGLTDLNVRVDCERCLEGFEFPQGSFNLSRTPWAFRVVGPYAVPNYAAGAYATLLALRVFDMGLGDSEISFTTSLELDLSGVPAEIDFALWHQRPRLGGQSDEPAFVIGEAKSFGEEALTSDVVDQLRKVADTLPGVFIAVAVLKTQLSAKEKARIQKLAKWGSVRLSDGRPRASVIVLTGLELLSQGDVLETWRDVGGRHAKLAAAGNMQLDNLPTLARVTQHLYLDTPLSGHTAKPRARGNK